MRCQLSLRSRPLQSFGAPGVLLLAVMAAPAAAAGDWSQWRGPLSTGVHPDADPPVTWSETENVRWKAPVPGHGHASPIVYGDRVYLLSAVALEPPPVPDIPPDADERTRRRAMRAIHPARHRFLVLAYERGDGSLVWQRTAVETVPADTTHRDATWASASAVTDGEVVLAHFGSQGLFAYGLDGDLLWQRDLGDMKTRNGFGEGASPAIAGDRVVVTWDHEGPDSFLVALDKRTGAVLWQTPRDEVTSWATPVVVEVDGRAQVVVPGTGASRGYDLETGEEIWQLAGMTTNVVPTPPVADGVAYLASGFRGAALQAVRLAGARGDLADGPSVLWAYDRDTPYVPSLLLYQDRLYFMKVNDGILAALDARTGAVVFDRQRLPGVANVYASPVAAAGRIYIPGRDGTTLVLAAGDAFEVLASNTLDEGIDASPAIAGDSLYLRGRHHLYRLAVTRPTADGLLDAAIAYHDPTSRWGRDGFRLALLETRPDAADRHSDVTLDPGRGRFTFRAERDGRVAEGRLVGDACDVRLDGSSTISDEDRDAFRLSCEQVARRRNYYDYLWGLPMKLRDPGTIVDPEVRETTFDGREVWGLRVTYAADVGGDIWYVYFDRSTKAMVGYRFYHDEAANDGEYIFLEGEVAAADLRLPRARTWYTHQGDRLLGTDTLTSLTPLD